MTLGTVMVFDQALTGATLVFDRDSDFKKDA